VVASSMMVLISDYFMTRSCSERGGSGVRVIEIRGLSKRFGKKVVLDAST